MAGLNSLLISTLATLVLSTTGFSQGFVSPKPVRMTASSSAEFRYDSGDHTRLAFIRDANGKVSGAVLNPGPSEIRATKIN
jgi:hypothetical protein